MSYFIPTSHNSECITTCPTCGFVMKSSTDKFVMMKMRLHFKVCKGDKDIDYNTYIENNRKTCEKISQQSQGFKKNPLKERKPTTDKLVLIE